MTEEQAKKKNCIFSVCATMFVKSQTNISIEGMDKLIKCNASDCMMGCDKYGNWLGYCGLNGKGYW